MPKLFKNPLLQIIIGFFLFFYALNQRTGNAWIDYAWLIAAIVGFAILGNGARNLRKEAGGIDQDRFK